MNQPKIWDYVLGGSAEINNIPNEAVDESSGSPSFKGLFPEITGIPITNGGIPVKRKDINALFKLIGEQIFFIQRGGVYTWDYNATYPKGAIVSHNDILYRALAESTSRDPTVDSESWAPLIEVTKEDLENVEVSDGSILEKGVVQLSNEISDDETMAVTPKAVKGVLDQLNDLVTQVGSLESTATTLSGQVSQNTNDISALQTKDTQIDSDIEALRSLIGDGSEIDLSGIQSQIDDIVAVNNQQNSDIEALKNSQGGNYDEEITALQASDTNQNGQIADINSKISTVESNISSLENTTSTLNGSINANTTNITDLTNRVSSLESQSPDGLQEQINGAVNRISSLEDLYEEFDLAGIYNYDADITYDAGSIVLYNNVLYKAIIESTGNLPTNTSFFEVYDLNPSLTQRVSTVEGNVSTNTTNISNLTTRVGNAETRISALEENPGGSQDLAEIETRLGTAETNISSLQSTDVTLSDRITALENGSGSGGDTSALESRIETIEGKVTTLENGLNDKADSSTVTALDTRVSDAESDISTLQTDLGTVNTTLSSKADSSTVTALDTRVGTVETVLASKAENSAVTANASSISALDTRVTALENSSSGGGSGGVSYQFYSLDPSGDTDDEVGFDNDGLEPYVTYLADSRNAVTGFSISSNTVTVNIDHTKDIRRMRIIVPAEALASQTITKTSPFRVLLRYDDSDKSENLYDGFKTNYIHPIAQVFQEGDQDTGSVQGNSAEMSVNKLWWDTDLINTGSPILQIAFTTTVASPIVVLLNF